MEGVNRGLESKALEIKLELAKMENGGVELTEQQKAKVIEEQMQIRAASRQMSRPVSQAVPRSVRNIDIND